MDPIVLGVAFALGFAARQIGLAPLGGFLMAGFGLTGTRSLQALLIALLFAHTLPFKVALFFALLTRFRLKARNPTWSQASHPSPRRLIPPNGRQVCTI